MALSGVFLALICGGVLLFAIIIGLAFYLLNDKS